VAVYSEFFLKKTKSLKLECAVRLCENVIVIVGHSDKSRLVGLFVVWPVGMHGNVPGEKEAGTLKETATVVQTVFTYAVKTWQSY